MDRVAADSHRGGLSHAQLGDLVDRLVGERPRAADDSDAALLVDVPGHDPDLAFPGRDDPGTVGADEARRLALERALDLHHVVDGNALGDADDERDLRRGRLEDRVRREGRRDEDDAGVGARLLDGLLDSVEDRHLVLEAGPALSGRDAGDEVGAVLEHLLGVEGPGAPGDALAEEARSLVDENAHDRSSAGHRLSPASVKVPRRAGFSG